VCVRLVQMNGLELSQFQFDYDQTFAVLFLNPDGTVYGRYGTRAGSGPNSTTHVSLASLGKAMERALALHQGYPGNRSKLAGKRGPAPPFRTVNDMPWMKDRPLRTMVNKGCIHCHQARDMVLREKWLARQLAPADLWVYPLPENTGMKLEVDDGLRVASVTAGSPAAQAGIRPGDELRALEGHPLVSQADVQWILNSAPDTCRLSAEVVRGGQPRTVSIPLAGEWKHTDISWRVSSGPGLRWGIWSQPLSAEEREKRAIPPGSVAMEVKNLFAPRADPLRAAGLRPGDVIVAADGKSAFANEGEFLAYLRLTHPPGDRAKLTVLRAGQRLDLDVPMW